MGTDYIFSSAFVRSHEKDLIKKEQFRAMINSDNIDEVRNQVTPALEDDMFDEIKDMSKEYKGLDVLIYQNDYHNIKVLLKAEELGKDYSDILIDKGTVPADVMTEAVRNRSGIWISEYMHKAILEAAEVLGRTKDPQLVDFVCDKYCFMEINKIADESKNEFIKGYVRLSIDAINFKTYIRMKALGQNWTYFKDLFIPGGNVDDVVYSRIFDADAATFASNFNGSALYEAITTGRDNLEHTGDYALIEKLCDDAIVEYIKTAKGISFGIEVLFAYLVAKQMEIKNIRILMAGKIAGMDPGKIEERIRKTYE